MYRHAPGTIWRRALKRADRRRDAYLASKATPDAIAHAQAVRLSNAIYMRCIHRPKEA